MAWLAKRLVCTEVVHLYHLPHTLPSIKGDSVSSVALCR